MHSARLYRLTPISSIVLYASTRDDLRPLGPEVFDGLVGMQFRAQSMSIRLDHPQAERKIVLVEDAPVGRLIIDASGDHIEVIDVALLPEYRNYGLGTSVLAACSPRPIDSVGPSACMSKSRAAPCVSTSGWVS